MATKKKKKEKKVGAHKPKKKVSGLTDTITEFAMRLAGTAAGALTGAFIIQAGDTAFGTSFPNMPKWVIPAGVAGTGALIPLIVKKNALAEDFGLGMLAIGSVFVANEAGLSVPGISGLAMSSNAGPANKVLRMAVGCRNNELPAARMGQATPNYLNRTVGMRKPSRARVGALLSN